MKKQHSQQPLPQIKESDLLHGMEDNPFVQWITDNVQKIFYTFAGAFILLFALYFWLSSGSAKAETDYYNATQDFQTFQNASDSDDPVAQKAAFDKLNQILTRRPDLHAKYDGLIAQTFLNRNEVNEAKPFADATLSRVSKDHLPLYIEYAQITLLIEQNQYSEALKRSVALKGQMTQLATQGEKEKQKRTFGDSLFAFNLLRIAMLEQKAGTPQEERNSWEEWKKYTTGTGNVQGIDSKSFFAVANLFSEGQISLNSYIDARLQQLSK